MDKDPGDMRDELRMVQHKNALVARPYLDSPVELHRRFVDRWAPSVGIRWGESSSRPLGVWTCPEDTFDTSCHSQGAMGIHDLAPR